MVDIQNNDRNAALPTPKLVVLFTLLGLLIACFVGWAFAFSIAVGSDSRPPANIYAAYNTFSRALLVECIVAVCILVLACCFIKEENNKLNKAAACGLILAGATNLVTAFVLIHTFDITYELNKVPLSTWILSSLPCLFWIIAGILILKLPGNEVLDYAGTPTTAELDTTTEAFLTEIGEWD
jgi:hypothetical protein